MVENVGEDRSKWAARRRSILMQLGAALSIQVAVMIGFIVQADSVSIGVAALGALWVIGFGGALMLVPLLLARLFSPSWLYALVASAGSALVLLGLLGTLTLFNAPPTWALLPPSGVYGLLIGLVASQTRHGYLDRRFRPGAPVGSLLGPVLAIGVLPGLLVLFAGDGESEARRVAKTAGAYMPPTATDVHGSCEAAFMDPTCFAEYTLTAEEAEILVRRWNHAHEKRCRMMELDRAELQERLAAMNEDWEDVSVSAGMASGASRYGIRFLCDLSGVVLDTGAEAAVRVYVTQASI